MEDLLPVEMAPDRIDAVAATVERVDAHHIRPQPDFDRQVLLSKVRNDSIPPADDGPVAVLQQAFHLGLNFGRQGSHGD